jgi:hypothetical protein
MGDEGIKISLLTNAITAVNSADIFPVVDASAVETKRLLGANLWTNESGLMTISNESHGDNMIFKCETAAGVSVTHIHCDPDLNAVNILGTGSTGFTFLVAANTNIFGRTGDLLIRNFSDGNNMVFTCDNAGGTSVSLVTLDPDGPETLLIGTLKIAEQAAANADTAGYGQLVIKNTTPCQLWFRDDAGTETQLA